MSKFFHHLQSLVKVFLNVPREPPEYKSLFLGDGPMFSPGNRSINSLSSQGLWTLLNFFPPTVSPTTLRGPRMVRRLPVEGIVLHTREDFESLEEIGWNRGG